MTEPSRGEVVRDVCHLVEQCVGALRSIPREHKVNVHCDLGDSTLFGLRDARHHMAEA